MIETWDLVNPPPAELTADDCAAVLAAMGRRLAEPTHGEVLAIIADLIRAFRPFIPKMPGGQRLDDLQALYLKVLSHVPTHYLKMIQERVEKTWRWGVRMPLPGELLALVRDDMSRATSTKAKAEILQGRLRQAAEAEAANDRLYWERRARDAGKTVEQIRAENDALVEDLFVHKFTRPQALARAEARARGEDPNLVCHHGENADVSGG